MSQHNDWVVVNKRSSVVTEGQPKVPTPSQLEYGEIAINYAAAKEHIYIKNSNNQVVGFPSEQIITSQIAASGLPQVAAADNLKVLQVIDGAWAVVTPLVVYSGNETPPSSLGNNGDIYLQTVDMLRAPDVVYETDGTTGLLGENSSSTSLTSWQLENMDFTPYRYAVAYIKQANLPLTGTSSGNVTPAMTVIIPLDAASRSTQYDAYFGSADGGHLNNKDIHFSIICAIDSTKTKFKVLSEVSVTGTIQGNRNSDGRYCYKIEGWY